MSARALHIVLIGIGLGLLVSGPATALASTVIIGGQEVGPNDPDLASVVGLVTLTPMGMGICTASIIAEDILVTAAHCVTTSTGVPVDPKTVAVVFGTKLEEPTGVQEVIALKANPKWKGARSRGPDQNDIAVIRFTGGLPSGYAPAKLLPSSPGLRNRQPVILMGYGVDVMNDQGGTGAGTLRKVVVPIAKAAFSKTETSIDQSAGKGACHGDSGGPAYVRSGKQLLLWGVTNRADPETGGDRCNQGAVYTRILAHKDFINSAARTMRAHQ
jgi:secreted trypsin-like serine protease